MYSGTYGKDENLIPVAIKELPVNPASDEVELEIKTMTYVFEHIVVTFLMHNVASMIFLCSNLYKDWSLLDDKQIMIKDTQMACFFIAYNMAFFYMN